jgi:peroxiredoxin
MRIIFLLAIVVFLSLPLRALALAVGEKAPLFTAPSTQGAISLSDYVGKKVVVLAFYFKDFTPG